MIEKLKADVAQYEQFRARQLEKAKECETTDPKRSARRWGDAKFLEGKIYALNEVISILESSDTLVLSEQEATVLADYLGIDRAACGFDDKECELLGGILERIPNRRARVKEYLDKKIKERYGD